MKTVWRDTIVEAYECEVQPQNIREGDWLLHDGIFVRVVTIQKGCLAWESNVPFTMFTCESEAGNILPIRSLQGWQTVLKKTRVKVIKLVQP